MSQFDDAKVLISQAAGHLSEIKGTYQSALTSKTVAPALLVQIKNFMENLRSSLKERGPHLAS
jgi:hypothetical protein